MFDPQAKFLPDVNPANPGKRIDILSPNVQEHFHDQIAPYAAFGSDLKSEFKGTLFRLPLRTAEQAATSRLSTKVHTTVDLLQMLGEFLQVSVSCSAVIDQ
jgi:sacsin